jgi:CheY-like chemotaxis protein
MRTVLVDDDYISIFLTKKLLEQEGLADELSTFLLPEKALHYVQQAIATEQIPDVILLDLNMPLLNGWEFIEALRPDEQHLLGRCFIYVLTSSLAPSDMVRANDFPLVTSLIHKPLDDIQIQAIHAQVLESRQSGQ